MVRAVMRWENGGIPDADCFGVSVDSLFRRQVAIMRIYGDDTKNVVYFEGKVL